jgi:hypothetical protein
VRYGRNNSSIVSRELRRRGVIVYPTSVSPKARNFEPADPDPLKLLNKINNHAFASWSTHLQQLS